MNSDHNIRLYDDKIDIILRDWELEDLVLFHKFKIGHHKWMDYNGPYYANMNQEELESHIQNMKRRIKENNFSFPRTNLVIADKKQNSFIGTVSCYWQSKETNWLSIGLVIYDDKEWGKGIGYQALRLWCDYLFTNMPELVRLDMRTWSGNHGMMKLAEKLGFKLEATFRKARIVKGEYFDSIGYGILKEEFYE